MTAGHTGSSPSGPSGVAVHPTSPRAQFLFADPGSSCFVTNSKGPTEGGWGCCSGTAPPPPPPGSPREAVGTALRLPSPAYLHPPPALGAPETQQVPVRQETAPNGTDVCAARSRKFQPWAGWVTKTASCSFKAGTRTSFTFRDICTMLCA